MTTEFVEKLRAVQAQHQSWLCVGLDPIAEQLPSGVDVLTFGKAIVDATADLVCAYKPNLYFYLSAGAEGLEALRQTIAHVPDHIPVILDAKFGDIGYTAPHYARVAFDVCGADGVTVNPYVGMDAVTPLLGHRDRMVFVLVRSSNTTGNDFQNWPNERSPLYRFVTAQTNTLACDHPGELGLLVSATQPGALIEMRSYAPKLPFLIPGLGAQAGHLDVSIRYGVTVDGIGPLLSVTRAVIYASHGLDFAEAARAAASEWVAQIRSIQAASAGSTYQA
jgi:orotidine-5'-phosphate decarboxylase